jgi:hypothetical protein
VGTADDGSGIVNEAGTVLQQGAGTERIGISGSILNAVLHLRCQFLERQRQ